MLKIDGVVIPTPSSFDIGIEDISKTERNANGKMIIERIATKRKLECSWNYLTSDKLSALFKAVSPVFFTVEYIDPVDNVIKTGTFYSEDRKAGALDYKDGIIRYKDISFNMVER